MRAFWKVATCFVFLRVGISSRVSFNLDGMWKFTLSAPKQSGMIQVPGAWEAQHFGQETKEMRWQVVTGDNARGYQGAVGLYQKTVGNISCPIPGSRKILAIDHGIHRSANISVAGVYLASHTGYLTPFEADITKFLHDSSNSVLVEISLSGGRNGSSDGLIGAADEDTDQIGLGGWAGLNGHVSIQCRPPMRIDSGIANTVPPHVTYPRVEATDAGKAINISVTFSIVGGLGIPSLKICDQNGETVSSKDGSLMTGNVTINIEVPAIKLWTPDKPHLYEAFVSVRHTSEGAVMDAVSTRFGLRTVRVEGYKFRLNGLRLFLNGYGDDAIYPTTVAPPRSQAAYRTKLKFARAHGFNYVRHHSHVLPEEYFAMADEVGMLVSPELPCAYGKYYRGTGKVGRELYEQTWSSYILRLRNHPSIMDWSMCNEYVDGIPQRQEFYDIAKSLDPSRLVIDADGLTNWLPGGYNRSTLDFHAVQFYQMSMGAWGNIPLGKGFKYYDTCSGSACSFKSEPHVPVISHETGNYNTFPRITELVAKFNSSGSTFKPFWLTDTQNHLLSLDLLKESEAWATATEHLYAMCWKIDIEDLRHNAMISGYQWWTIQDFWTGNNGLVDTFFKPKQPVVSIINQFNTPSVLLQVGLDFAYVSRDILNVSISLSNFEETDVTPESHTVSWVLQMCSRATCSTISNFSGAVPAQVPQGELRFVANVVSKLPDIGFFSFQASPATINLEVSLATTQSAARVTHNSWNATLFPKWIDTPSVGFDVVVTSPDLLSGCMFSNCKLNQYSQRSVYMTTSLQDNVMEAVHNGSVAVLLQQDSNGYYPSERTLFKQAWWLGSDTDNNAGTFVYDDPSGVFQGMAPMYYGDVTWFRMLEGAQTFLLEEFSTSSRPEVLVRAIDISRKCRSKALCFRMKVGKGYIIGVGMNLLQSCSAQGCPAKEKAWVLYKLLMHAGELLSRGPLSDTTYI